MKKLNHKKLRKPHWERPNEEIYDSIRDKLKPYWHPEKVEVICKAAEFAADIFDKYVETHGDWEPMLHFQD